MYLKLIKTHNKRTKPKSGDLFVLKLNNSWELIGLVLNSKMGKNEPFFANCSLIIIFNELITNENIDKLNELELKLKPLIIPNQLFTRGYAKLISHIDIETYNQKNVALRNVNTKKILNGDEKEVMHPKSNKIGIFGVANIAFLETMINKEYNNS